MTASLLVAFFWLLGINYSQQTEIQNLTLLLNQRHLKFQARQLVEQRQQDTEARIREAGRLARQRAFQKLTQFLAAVDAAAQLQKNDELFLVISFSEGRLFIKRGEHTLKEYVVSLGSGKVMRQEEKKWIFETPRGIFPVQTKKEDPVWIKPDWAFVEKNEPIPPLDSPLRRVKGNLGKFGIYLGQGYLIHGTLPEIEPLIGLNISHGCIRMLEHDLKEVYDTVQIGTKVVIR